MEDDMTLPDGMAELIAASKDVEACLVAYKLAFDEAVDLSKTVEAERARLRELEETVRAAMARQDQTRLELLEASGILQAAARYVVAGDTPSCPAYRNHAQVEADLARAEAADAKRTGLHNVARVRAEHAARLDAGRSSDVDAGRVST